MDPRRSNGGVFLGLNGIVMKSHGGTDAEGFAAAIELAHDMAKNELLANLTAGLAQVGFQLPTAEVPSTPRMVES